MGDAPAVDDLLEERPDLESALETVSEVDQRQETWTFEDVDIDSGAFGELVSRGIAEKHDGEYRLSDPDAVRAALEGELGKEDTTAGFSLSSLSPDLDIDRRAGAALAGALALVAVFRLVSLPAVFRENAVVLSGNDPYYYRYWVERLLAESGGAFDFSVLSGLPGAVAKGEPLMVATLWWASAILGGGVSGAILAWYPVVAAVVAAALVYLLATELTDDRRIGLAAVLLLAVTPGHALRTGLGFADHHAFDYPWLALTALAVVALARRRAPDALRQRGPWVAAGALGVGIAGQVMAWEAGPLLAVPVGFAVAVLVLYDVRDGRSPARTNAPFVAGLALASVLAAFFHTGFGWHTDQVAYTPALLLVGVVGVLAIAEAVHRLDGSVRLLAGIEVLGLAVAVVAFSTLLPTYWARLMSQMGRLLGQKAIAEVQPLFAASTFGFLLLFGWVLVLAIPYMAWGVLRAYRGDDGPRWAVAGIYAWYFLLLASLQMRFAGQLAHFSAVFAALGFVHLAERIDVARPPAPFESATRAVSRISLPDKRQASALVILFLLVSSLGIVMVPVKTSQVTIGDQQYQAAAWMDDYAEKQGWEYPENYVLSPWGRNRMYNYFVSGQSRSYGFAQTNYDAFMRSNRSRLWYQQRLKNRVGFVVTQDVSNSAPRTTHTRLHRHYGSRSDGIQGLSHYRAVYQSGDGSLKVFTVVPGARISGEATSDATVTLTTEVQLAGTSFTYERQAHAGPNGTYQVVVPYPGEYSVNGQSVKVSETAVHNGSIVRV